MWGAGCELRPASPCSKPAAQLATPCTMHACTACTDCRFHVIVRPQEGSSRRTATRPEGILALSGPWWCACLWRTAAARCALSMAGGRWSMSGARGR